MRPTLQYGANLSSELADGGLQSFCRSEFQPEVMPNILIRQADQSWAIDLLLRSGRSRSHTKGDTGGGLRGQLTSSRFAAHASGAPRGPAVIAQSTTLGVSQVVGWSAPPPSHVLASSSAPLSAHGPAPTPLPPPDISPGSSPAPIHSRRSRRQKGRWHCLGRLARFAKGRAANSGYRMVRRRLPVAVAGGDRGESVNQIRISWQFVGATVQLAVRWRHRPALGLAADLTPQASGWKARPEQ